MQQFLVNRAIPIERVDLSLFGIHQGILDIKREDLIHPYISGNKFRKLKYNIIAARDQGENTLLTFGGAYSNHIAAVAAVGKECGFKTIGIIRGEELWKKVSDNPTLTFAQKSGMQLRFVTRADYRHKDDHAFIDQLRNEFGDFFLVPEGGTNPLAVKGCEEILDKQTKTYDVICVSVGTGGTMAGLVKSAEPHQELIGFSALKGTFQTAEIGKYTDKTNFRITDSYSFGGYGKIDSELIRFINEFKSKTRIQLDPIYTGKMIYGIFDLLKKGHFNKNCRIFALHTGGLQGIAGMNRVLVKKNLPIIE